MYYRWIVLPVISVALIGCLYIPMAEHGLLSGRAMIRQADIDALEPGKTTRADVLLKFGDPAERFDDDEYFCYRWVRVRGVLIFWDPGVFGDDIGDAEFGKTHYFCAQFSPENLLVRGEHIEAFWRNAENKRDEILDSWEQAGAELSE